MPACKLPALQNSNLTATMSVFVLLGICFLSETKFIGGKGTIFIDIGTFFIANFLPRLSMLEFLYQK
jgi:hypothetical protein